jgi:hypothetical protein
VGLKGEIFIAGYMDLNKVYFIAGYVELNNEYSKQVMWN